MYKVVEGMIPAFEPGEFLKKARPMRNITAKKIEDYHATNILQKQVKNNSKCFDIPPSKTPQYSNSFFLKTEIACKQLDDTVVRASSVESL